MFSSKFAHKMIVQAHGPQGRKSGVHVLGPIKWLQNPKTHTVLEGRKEKHLQKVLLEKQCLQFT